MLRTTATLALALCLLGCNAKAPPGDPVQLLTGVMPFDEDECGDVSVAGLGLVVEPKFGTALAVEFDGGSVPVMWPPGFTGRRSGFEVMVVDPDGNLVATTGESYRISGNVLIEAPKGGWPNRDDRRYKRGWIDSIIGPDMFYVCSVGGPHPTASPIPMI